MLVATIIEAATLNEELWHYYNVVDDCYIADLAEKPTFVSLGQNLTNTADKLYGSELLGCFRSYERLSIEEKNNATDKDTLFSIKFVDKILSGAQKSLDKLIEECNESGSYKRLKVSHQ